MNAGASAHAGHRAFRWSSGMVLAACAALAVLVHHETAATSMAHMAAAAEHSGQISAPSVVLSSEQPGEHGKHGQDVHQPAPGSHDGACKTAGMQHCTTANVDTPKAPAPPVGDAAQTPHSEQGAAGVMPAGTVSRAPPDLSVLCLLRI